MRICLVSSNLGKRNWPLQPWCYLLETADTLVRSGHDVRLVSDGYPRLSGGESVAGLPAVHLASLRDWPLRGNPQVIRTVTSLQPDVLLWHVGLTSFLHLGTLRYISTPVIGVFTSPVYRPRELLRMGFLRLLRGYRLSAIHLLGALVPGALIRRALHQDLIGQLVVECDTTRARLIQRGALGDRVHVIRPGVAPAWFEAAHSPAKRACVRNELELSAGEFVVGYFGPPTPLRGLPILLKSVAMARRRDPRLKLLVLSRQRGGESRTEHRAVERLIRQMRAERWTRVVEGFLPQARLIQTVAACDVVVLPFEVVPSDVPMSVLEAVALGVPVITTRVVCLPELVPEGAGLCVPPGDSPALAEAILSSAASAACARPRQWSRTVGKGKPTCSPAIPWGAWGGSGDAWSRVLNKSLSLK